MYKIDLNVFSKLLGMEPEVKCLSFTNSVLEYFNRISSTEHSLVPSDVLRFTLEEVTEAIEELPDTLSDYDHTAHLLSVIKNLDSIIDTDIL